MGVQSMKRFICSAAVASALLAATVVPSGAVTVGDTFASSGPSDPVSFDLTYNFTTTGSPLVMSAASETNITDFSFVLTKGGTIQSSTFVSSPAFDIFCSDCTVMTAGTFVLTVMGIAETASGGNFTATFSAPGLTSSISQTPIPGTLVLFVSGLGLLGFWGFSKGRKAESGTTSLEAIAC
jgi:hypothetical protein